MTPDKDALERAITGDPVLVHLGDKDYPIAFPAYAVALYHQETARLNCARARAALDAGRAKLTPAEARELKKQYRQIAGEMEDHRERFADLIEELVAIRLRLDEEAGNGDSLFLIVNWWKIRPDDPERVLLALWCGLHQEAEEGQWKAPFTVSQLRKLVDFSNFAPILHAITAALGHYMPRITDEGKRPNAAGPGEPAAAEKTLNATAG